MFHIIELEFLSSVAEMSIHMYDDEKEKALLPILTNILKKLRAPRYSRRERKYLDHYFGDDHHDKVEILKYLFL